MAMTIYDLAVESNLRSFDIESTQGLHGDNHIVALGFHNLKDGTAREIHRAHTGVRSAMGRHFYDITAKGRSAQQHIEAAGNLANPAGFYSQVHDAMVGSGGSIGHNLNFDYRMTLTEMAAHNKVLADNVAKGYGVRADGTFKLMNQHGIYGTDTPQEVRSAVSRAQGSRAYTQYTRHLFEQAKAGNKFNIDTHTLTSIFLAGVKEKGYGDFSDVFTGTKLSFIKAMNPGLVSDSGSASHTIGHDTSYAADYLKVMSDDILGIFHNRGLSEKGHRLAASMQYIQDHTSWGRFQKEKSIYEFAGQELLGGKSFKYEIAGQEQVFNSKQDLIGAMSRTKKYASWSTEAIHETWNKAQAHLGEVLKPVTGDDARLGAVQDDIFSRFFTSDKSFIESEAEHGAGGLAGAFEKWYQGGGYKVPNENAPLSGRKFIAPGELNIKNRNRFLKYAGIGLGIATAFSIASTAISGNHRDYNTIEGMHEDGSAAQMRKANTDFGSPLNLVEFAKSVAHGLMTETRAHPSTFFLGGAYGFYTGATSEEGVSAGGFISNMAIDLIDDVLLFGAPHIGSMMGEKGGKVASYIEMAKPVLEHKYAKMAGVGFFGYTVGKLSGEIVGQISGNHRAYNTVAGMHEGGMAAGMRHQATDFGSPWLGLWAKSIRTAKDNVSGAWKGIKSSLKDLGVDIQNAKTKILNGESVKEKGHHAAFLPRTPTNADHLDSAGIKGNTVFISDRKTFPAEYGSISEELLAVIAMHEASEAHYVSVVKNPRNLSSGAPHYSTGVIADEALMAKAMGKDAFNAARDFRLRNEVVPMENALAGIGDSTIEGFFGEGRIESVDQLKNYTKRVRTIYDNVDRKGDKILDRLSGISISKPETPSLPVSPKRGFFSKIRNFFNSTEINHGRTSSNIEGLHPGGGVGKNIIQSGTDFGSGFIGIAQSIAHEFMTTVRAHPTTAFAGGAVGLVRGYEEGKENGVSVGGFAKNMALDMADDVLIFGAPAITSALGAKGGKFASFMDAAKPILEHRYAKQAGVGFFGYSVGKIIGETLGSISGKDDAYNTINGLHHGGYAQQMRKASTDFGSGYQGSASPVHHPELEESYNTATDVPVYEQFRASGIGDTPWGIYKSMTEGKGEMSPYVQASAGAGTALHKLMQAEAWKTGTAIDTEVLADNRAAGVSGHADIITEMGVGDIKTVSSGIFKAVQKEGRAKPMHKAQVNFYLGTMGIDNGYVQYVNRDKPNQQKLFFQQFNANQYEDSLRKVDRERRRVQAMTDAGELTKSSLPRTASIDTLRQAAANKETPQQQVDKVMMYNKMFQEEMAYMRMQKRGMPTGGIGRERVDQRSKQKREAAMTSTQGIGLEIWNHRSGHHIM